MLGNAFLRVTDVVTSSALKAIPSEEMTKLIDSIENVQVDKKSTNLTPVGVGREGTGKRRRRKPSGEKWEAIKENLVMLHTAGPKGMWNHDGHS
jgi:hypothetical protein